MGFLAKRGFRSVVETVETITQTATDTVTTTKTVKKQSLEEIILEMGDWCNDSHDTTGQLSIDTLT